jgi:hypothetical protein
MKQSVPIAEEPVFSPSQDPEDCISKFFHALHGSDDLPGFLNIWTLPDKKSIFLPQPYGTLASNKCRELAQTHDVYFGVGLLREALSPDRRGRAEDVTAIPGLWADIDIKGPNHVQDSLPKNLEEAAALTHSLPLKPSLTIFSGGGIQAYWLFKKPWVFDSAQERERAAKLSKRFQAKLLAEAAKRGWKIDNTSDLARVLRVPGTYNRKHGQVPVKIIEYHPDCRYDPSEFEPWIAADVKESAGPNGNRVDPQWIFSGIPEGRRNVELYRYSSSLRSRNVPLVEAQVLIAAAAKDCKPEYPADEAITILKRAFREYPSGSNGAKESDWTKPQELPPLLPEAPAFPTEMLPGGLRPWLEDIAERMQVPLEVPAAAALVALSTVVGRNLGIHPKRHDDWLVIPNLWGLVVGPPGILKTPAANEALKPLGNLSAQASKEFEDMQARNRAADISRQARVEAIKDLMKKAVKSRNQFEFENLESELSALLEFKQPTERRYRVNDATVEKLVELLKDNPRGLLMYRDELFGWLRNLDKIGREGDRTFFLESWNGNGDYTQDRIARGTIRVKGVCISIFGTIQPGRLNSYIEGAINGGQGDDGLIQRFQVAVYPEQAKTWKNIDRYPDHRARDRAYRIFSTIDSLDPETCGVVPDKFSGIAALRFEREAQEFFDDWRLKLETRLRSGEIESSAYKDHLGKFRSLMPSLALLLHLTDWADAQMDMESPLALGAVSLQSAKLAAAWCDYLETHARKIFAGAIRPDLRAAHALAARIRQHKIKDGTSVREIYRNQWASLTTKEDVYDGLAILSELGWVRVLSVQKKEGVVSDEVKINPLLRGETHD